MSSNMRVFYLYIISLITLIMFASGIIATVYNITRYIFPSDYYFFSEDTLTIQTDVVEKNNNEIGRQNYKKETIKDSIVSVLVIVIGFSLYKYHWNLIEKERKLINN